MRPQSDNAWLDDVTLVRGLACLLVVSVHVTAEASITQPFGFAPWQVLLNQLARFGTPLFSVVSGLLLARQSFEPVRFFRARLMRVGVPFVLWSVIYLEVVNIFRPPALATSPKAFVIAFTHGQASPHLYFMSVVLQFYVVFAVLALILRSERAWRTAFLLAMLVNAAMFVILPTSEGLFRRAWLPYWIGHFLFGCLVGRNWQAVLRFVDRSRGPLLLAMLAVVVGGLIEVAEWGLYDSARLANLVNVPIVFLAALAVVRRLRASSLAHRALLSAGRYSYGLYLVHVAVIMALVELYRPLFGSEALVPFAGLLVVGVSLALVRILGVISGGLLTPVRRELRPPVESGDVLRNAPPC